MVLKLQYVRQVAENTCSGITPFTDKRNLFLLSCFIIIIILYGN